jgi:sporulation protein YlmC with PRC-barrel domain
VDNIRGREIQTDGGTRLGVVEDVILDLDLQVLGLQLGKVYVQGPLAQKKAIVRDAVLDPGGKDQAMIVDLVTAESGTIPTA